MRSSIKTAAIAAIVSIGLGASSATAASMIGSSQVKDNSLTTRDVKDGTLTTADLSVKARAELKGNQGAAGALGATGPAGVNGANGANGVQGPAGGFDPAKVTYIAGPKVTIAASTPGNPSTGLSTARCPAGTRVIAGGYFFGYNNGGVTVEVSSPLSDGTGWAAGFGNAGTVAGEATAYAVCAAK